MNEINCIMKNFLPVGKFVQKLDQNEEFHTLITPTIFFLKKDYDFVMLKQKNDNTDRRLLLLVGKNSPFK